MDKIGRTIFLAVMLVICIPVFLFARGADEAQVRYPTRPVELVVPMGAGGTQDLGARAVVAVIQKYLGQPMTVTLRPGASGVIGTTELATAARDGYRLLSASTGPLTALPVVQEVSYTADSFVPIAMLSYAPLVIIVPGDSPYNSISELIDAINANPGRMNCATTGAFSNAHIPSFQLWHAAGVVGKIAHVHYDGGGPQAAALLGGQADVGAAMPATVQEQVRAGRLRALAVTDTQRIPATELDGLYKDVPTLQELGYDVVFRMWRGVMAPAGIPQEVELLLRDVFRRVSEDPEYIELLERIGEPTYLYMDGPDFKRFWDEERATLTPILNIMRETER